MKRKILVENLGIDGAQDASEISWYSCLVTGESMDPMDASKIFGQGGHEACRDCGDLLGCEEGARKIPHL